MTVLSRLHTIVLIDIWPPFAPALPRLSAPGGFRIDRVADEATLWRRLSHPAAELALVLPLSRYDDPQTDLLPALAARDRCPTLVLLNEGGPRERTVLLERGAADVLTPPFLEAEILARLAARWRMRGLTPATGARHWRFGAAILDPDTRTLRRADGQTTALTGAEFDLLAVLVEAGGRPLSRAQLLDATRGRSWDVEDRSIDVMIGRLRRKLEADPQAPQFIQTVRGFGYRLTGASTREERGSAPGFGWPRRVLGRG